MNSRTLTIILFVSILLVFSTLVPKAEELHLPGNHQGYEPNQPIEFSHRLHASKLNISCLYCHSGAEKSRHAGIPPANLCMNCHQFVRATFDAVKTEEMDAEKEKRATKVILSSEIQKIYDALGLNKDLQKDPAKESKPIEWVKIHQLPDFTYFDHRVHVSAKISCQECHGLVESMEKVRQVKDLTMGWCVNCHREANKENSKIQKRNKDRKINATYDCTGCHY